MVKIAPSILSADFAYICDEIKKVEDSGADLLHIDVMDGHFVPNITLGAPIISCLRKITKLPFDVHLMIEKPERYIDDFIDAGADILTVHAEASLHLHRTINYIKNRGIIPAIALNPSTSLDCLKYVLDDVGMILIMSVNPGFGGQKFISNMLGKIRDLKK
jgi:ribulose-phosphate 3-epimerase